MLRNGGLKISLTHCIEEYGADNKERDFLHVQLWSPRQPPAPLNQSPPTYDLVFILRFLPLCMAPGGNNGLADPIDVVRTIQQLRSKSKVIVLPEYGHSDLPLEDDALRLVPTSPTEQPSSAELDSHNVFSFWGTFCFRTLSFQLLARDS
jgi:hypothetical protein